MAKRGSHNWRYILHEKVPVPVEDLLEWAHWVEEHFEQRIVKQEEVGPYWVSTVFLGLDHDFTESGPPLLFETIVCHGRGGDGVKDAPFARTSTWELALETHTEAVVWAKEQLS